MPEFLATLLQKVAELFQSRRFYLAIVAAVVAFSDYLGLGLDKALVEQIVMILAAWIVGDSLRETTGPALPWIRKFTSRGL